MMLNLVRAKTTLILGLVQALLAMAISFGIHLTTEQVGAIMAVAALVVAIVSDQTSIATSQVDKATQAIASLPAAAIDQIKNGSGKH